MKNKNAFRYLKSLKKQILCPSSIRNKIISDFTENLAFFIDENPNASYEELVKHFGSPEEVSNSFLLSIDTDELTLRMEKTQKKKHIVLITCIIAILLLIGCYFIMIKDNQSTQINYIEVSSSITQ